MASNFISLPVAPTIAPMLVGTTSNMNSTTGTGGQLFYNNTYSHYFFWSVDRWLPFGTPDPRYGFILYDEFLGSDRIGTLDWNMIGTVNQVAGLSGTTFGQYQLSQSSATNISNLRMNLNSFALGTADIYLETAVYLTTLSNGTDEFSMGFGFYDTGGVSYSATSAPTNNGVWFGLDSQTNANWIINAMKAGVQTNTTTASAPSAATWYRLGILCAASGTITFYVNGVSIGTVTTNIPAANGGVVLRLDKVAGASARTANFDYFYAYAFFNGQRVS